MEKGATTGTHTKDREQVRQEDLRSIIKGFEDKAKKSKSRFLKDSTKANGGLGPKLGTFLRSKHASREMTMLSRAL